MSGPKIVRVVTREEVVATCNSLVAQLGHAADTWMKECRRLRIFDAADAESVQKVQGAIAALMQNEKFLDLQKRVPEEIAFLNSDLERRRVRAAEAAAQAIQQARQRRENAIVLLRELRRRSFAGHDEVISAIEKIASGKRSGAGTEALLAAGFGLLASEKSAVGLTDEQRALAAKLAPEESPLSFAEWKKAHLSGSDSRISDLERRLGEMEARFGVGAAAGYMERMRVFEILDTDQAKNLKIDTLVLDVAEAMKTLKDKAALFENAEALVSELSGDNIETN